MTPAPLAVSCWGSNVARTVQTASAGRGHGQLRAVGLAGGQDRIGDARELVGQGDGGDLERTQPLAQHQHAHQHVDDSILVLVVPDARDRLDTPDRLGRPVLDGLG